MAIQVDIDAVGIDEAETFMQAISMAVKAECIAEWYSPTRSDGLENDQLLEWHAEPKTRSDGVTIRRNVLPTDAEQTAAVNLFATEFIRQMDLRSKAIAYNETKAGTAYTKGKRKGQLRAARNVRAASDVARAGIVGGMRKAIKQLAADIKARFIAGRNNTGAPLTPVLGPYADRRKKEHGVATDVVLYATGDLATAVNSEDYKIKYNRELMNAAVGVLDK